MRVEITRSGPEMVRPDLVAAAAGPVALALGAPERAVADADPVALVYREGAPLAVVAVEPGVEGLRTAAARAVRACRDGGSVAWALDASLPVPPREQVHALAEGAVIGGYDGHRWGSGPPRRGVERFVICGGDEGLSPIAQRAALVARWTNTARELVDAPPNVISPAGLAERAAALPGLATEIVDPDEAGLAALAAVGQSSPAPLLRWRHHVWPSSARR
jgi:leucyl aminopeptidase